MKQNRLILPTTVTLAIGAALLLGEFVVRIFDLPPRPLTSLNVANYVLSENPVLRYEYRAHQKPTDPGFDLSHEGFATNSDGLRDREYTPSKPKGTVRIITLGDSITAGNGIPVLDDIYPKVLERRLNLRSTAPRVEVLNFGVGGYHTLQEVERLRVRGLKYEPDVVVIGFCLNDFFPESDGGVYGALMGRMQPIEKNLLPRLAQTGNSLTQFLLRHSRSSFFVYHRVRAMFEHSLPGAAVGSDTRNVVHQGLEQLDWLRKKEGFRAYLFIIPAFFPNFAKYPFLPVHKMLGQIASGYPQIQLIDLLPKFAAISDDGAYFSSDGVHPNRTGHAWLARFIEDQLTNDNATSPRSDLYRTQFEH